MAMQPIVGHKTIKVKQNTIYDQFEFPDYAYEEFPKGIPVNEAGEVQESPYRDVGKRRELWDVVMVQDQAEYDALMAGAKLVEVNPTAIESSPKRVETEQDVKDRLMALAKDCGAHVDGRWSPERMQAALDAHNGKAEVV